MKVWIGKNSLVLWNHLINHLIRRNLVTMFQIFVPQRLEVKLKQFKSNTILILNK